MGYFDIHRCVESHEAVIFKPFLKVLSEEIRVLFFRSTWARSTSWLEAQTSLCSGSNCFMILLFLYVIVFWPFLLVMPVCLLILRDGRFEPWIGAEAA